jgi:hypothetical protein
MEGDAETEGGAQPTERPGNRIVGRVRERMASELNARKDRASDVLGQLATGVRQMGQPLHDDALAGLGSIVDKAASRLEEVAEGMRERDVTELADEVRTLARRRPAAFMAAGFATGLLAARFLKSSAAESGASREAGPGRTAARRDAGPGAATARRTERARGKA